MYVTGNNNLVSVCNAHRRALCWSAIFVQAVNTEIAGPGVTPSPQSSVTNKPTRTVAVIHVEGTELDLSVCVYVNMDRGYKTGPASMYTCMLIWMEGTELDLSLSMYTVYCMSLSGGRMVRAPGRGTYMLALCVRIRNPARLMSWHTWGYENGKSEKEMIFIWRIVICIYL